MKKLFSQSGDVSSFIDSFMPAFTRSRDRTMAMEERKRSKQKLSEIFGGEVPEILKGMENVPLDQFEKMGGPLGAMFSGINRSRMADTAESRAAEEARRNPVVEAVAQGGLELNKQKEATETSEKTRVANQKRLDGLIDEKENLMDVARDPDTSFKERDMANARIDQIIVELGMPKRVKGAISKITDPIMRSIFGGAQQPGAVQAAPASAPAQAAPVQVQQQAPVTLPKPVQSISEVKTAPDGTRYRVINGQVEIVQ